MTKEPTYQELKEEVKELRRKLSGIKGEEYFRELMKNNTDAFSVIDKNGINVFQSDSNATILGYTPEERRNKNAFELMVPEDGEKMKQLFQSRLKEFGVSININFRAYHKDGSTRYLEGTAKNMLHSPLINGIIINYRDVTDRKKAEKALKEREKSLRKLNKTKDKFFSIIAHDLTGPFNSLLGFSEILKQDFEKFDQNEQKEYIDIIYNGLLNTYKLLENLLLWSRSQTKNVDFNPETVNLYLLVNETIQPLKHLLENKFIELSLEIGKDIHIEADRNMLSTIIRNLVSNAVKFTHKGGKISIQSDVVADGKEDGFVIISVIDNGIGIPNEMQSKLFKISKNRSAKGTENETGTGLGLILCKEFVKKHGGKIWVESETGKGSRFVFSLPLSQKRN